MVVDYHKQLVPPLLLRFSIVLNVDPMDPVHGEQATQVGHPPAFQCLESGEIFFPGSRVTRSHTGNFT